MTAPPRLHPTHPWHSRRRRRCCPCSTGRRQRSTWMCTPLQQCASGQGDAASTCGIYSRTLPQQVAPQAALPSRRPLFPSLLQNQSAAAVTRTGLTGQQRWAYSVSIGSRCGSLRCRACTPCQMLRSTPLCFRQSGTYLHQSNGRNSSRLPLVAEMRRPYCGSAAVTQYFP